MAQLTKNELDEFEQQIAMQSAHAIVIAPEIENTEENLIKSKQNYTDKDGVEFEWDASLGATGGFVPILSESMLTQNQDNYQYQAPEYSTDDQGRQVYTDPESKLVYTWDNDKQSWFDVDGNEHKVDQAEEVSNDLFKDWKYNEDDMTYTDPHKNKWTYDYHKCQWLNDDGWFLAENPIDKSSLEAIEPDTGSRYRFISNGKIKRWVELEPEKMKAEIEQNEDEKKGKKKRKNGEWFDMDEEKRTVVYVKGLPPSSITVDAFEEMMKRYGIIQHDPVRNRPKVKLYTDRQTGVPKGDGIVFYVKRESVKLSIDMLHEARCPLDNDLIMHVEEAKFEQKGEKFDDRKGKKRRKLTKKEKQLLAKREERIFAWKECQDENIANLIEEETTGNKPRVNLKVLIFKSVFPDPKIFKKQPMLIERIRVELRKLINGCLDRSVQFDEEVGDKVKKLVLFDRNVEGVCSVAFKNQLHAEYVKNTLDKKMFIVPGMVPQTLSVAHWDGRTNYLIEETIDEEEKRDEDWENFLHQE